MPEFTRKNGGSALSPNYLAAYPSRHILSASYVTATFGLSTPTYEHCILCGLSVCVGHISASVCNILSPSSSHGSTHVFQGIPYTSVTNSTSVGDTASLPP